MLHWLGDLGSPAVRFIFLEQFFSEGISIFVRRLRVMVSLLLSALWLMASVCSSVEPMEGGFGDDGNKAVWAAGDQSSGSLPTNDSLDDPYHLQRSRAGSNLRLASISCQDLLPVVPPRILPLPATFVNSAGLELGRVWQFVWRAASSARAPSLVG